MADVRIQEQITPENVHQTLAEDPAIKTGFLNAVKSFFTRAFGIPSISTTALVLGFTLIVFLIVAYYISTSQSRSMRKLRRFLWLLNVKFLVNLHNTFPGLKKSMFWKGLTNVKKAFSYVFNILIGQAAHYVVLIVMAMLYKMLWGGATPPPVAPAETKPNIREEVILGDLQISNPGQYKVTGKQEGDKVTLEIIRTQAIIEPEPAAVEATIEDESELFYQATETIVDSQVDIQDSLNQI